MQVAQSYTFTNRAHALERLLEVFALKNLDVSQTVILATSFDGIFFADALASKLKVPLDYLFSEVITAPLNNECKIAIVSEELDIVMNENLINAFEISLDYVYGEAKRQYEDSIIPTRYEFRKGELLSSLNGRDILIVDQGIDTGLTAMCAIKTCINMHAKSIKIAVPIMSVAVKNVLSEICDEVLCVQALENFVSINHYYKDFEPIEPKTIESILNTHLNKKTKGEKNE